MRANKNSLVLKSWEIWQQLERNRSVWRSCPLMCLANGFAALSAPCVRRERLHIITFPFHLTYF